jgi:translation initiation factor IF-1
VKTQSQKSSQSKKPVRPGNANRRRRQRQGERREDRIYLDGKVIETLPGTRFKVRIDRSKGLEPLIVDCQVKTLFKVKNIKIIKGDLVTVEIDPELDLDPENNLAKGIIIQRM